jgi:hypothetical protein
VNVSHGQARLLAATVLVAVLGIAAVHESSTGARELAAADANAAKGHWPEAIAHARAAAEAVAPASPWSERGFRKLESIGLDATARGDEGTARCAYGAMRTAALQARSPWSDHSDWEGRAEEGLSRLVTAAPDPASPGH